MAETESGVFVLICYGSAPLRDSTVFKAEVVTVSYAPRPAAGAVLSAALPS